MAAEVGHGGAVYLQSHLGDELLGQLHQVMVVGVGLVELEHGELGIVLGGDAFVAKVAVDLVNAVETADHQALEVELGRDAQVQRKVQRIMVGAEGPGGGASGDGLHHRGLHLDIPALIEKAPDRLQHLGALDEDLTHIGVHEEIDIALPVAELHVGQAVILLRQGQHRLGEKGDGSTWMVSSPVRVRKT